MFSVRHYLRNTELSGEIPSWIENFTQLEELGLSNNNLNSLNNLNWSKLVNLYRLVIADSNLSGTVPEELWNLPKLEIINLAFNQLTGQLPNSMSNSVYDLITIRGNFFSGPIPTLQVKDFVVENNLFNFSDLENLFELIEIYSTDQNATGFTDIKYGSQKNYAVAKTVTLVQDEPYSESINMQDWLTARTSYPNTNAIANLSSTNRYDWYKDGQYYSNATLNDLHISLPIGGPYKLSDAGKYTLQITNPNAPELTIIAYEITITVTEPLNPTQQLFEEYDWLKFIASPENCSNETITLYETGPYRYLYITNDNDSRLFNNQGTLYCTSTPNYDCLAAYNLTKVITNWSCQEGIADQEDTDNMEDTTNVEDTTTETETEEPTSSDNSIFETYTWLSTIIESANCSDEMIRVYQTGVYQYLHITDANGSKLYNQDGQLYCTDSPNYDCVSAYNLTEEVISWSCSTGAEETTMEIETEETEETTMETEEPTTSNNTLFETYSWLSPLINPSSCSDETITVYQTGVYQYLHITDASGSKLYNQDGQLYCTDSPNYDCVAAFSLTEVLDTWTCSNTTPEENNPEEQASTPPPGSVIAIRATAEQINTILFNNATTVCPPSFAGNDYQVGIFNQGSASLEFETGIILSTGRVEDARGPNESVKTGSAVGSSNNSDADLAQLAGTSNLHDVAVLEFAIIAQSDRLELEYVFASEEYCEYVGSEFNDIFGIFVSGEGINGSFERGAQNIATVPNSEELISINSINSTENKELYKSNSNVFSGCVNEWFGQVLAGISYRKLIEYDGFTVPLTATIPTTIGETYHIKIAIGDVADGIYDSAIFLNIDGLNLQGVCRSSEEVAALPNLFSAYPWLDDLVEIDNCTNQQVFLYETGVYQYLYVTSGDIGTLYNQDGAFYCSSTPTYDCVSAYNLTTLLDTWSCSSLQSPTIAHQAQRHLLEEVSFKVFPNPAKQQVFIELTDLEFLQTIDLIDVMGRTIRSVTLSDLRTEIDISQLEDGLYFFQYRINNHLQTVKLLIAE